MEHAKIVPITKELKEKVAEVVDQTVVILDRKF